jgi:hypothetical protein
MASSAGLLPCRMFNFGKPKTAGDWIVHIAGAIVAIFLVWWMLRVYVLGMFKTARVWSASVTEIYRQLRARIAALPRKRRSFEST